MEELNYLEANKNQHLEEMIECLKMETVSADPGKEEEIRRCGDWFVEKLKKIGFENAKLNDTGGLPAVYADWLHAGEDKPTILFYGHYDVQPAEPLDLWKTPPFEPVVRDGRIYGRGTADDKGQVMLHIFALEAILKTQGRLPINVKIFLESEEEGGKGGTVNFVNDNRKLLACDVVMLSDTSWITEDIPSVMYGLRGIAYFEVNVKGPNRDLHSGRFGGLVFNPLSAMSQIVARLHDENGRIAIPGFYDDVLELEEAERKEFAKLGNNEDELKKYLDVKVLGGEKGFTTYERVWGRPTLDLNGIWGGYTKEGGKTIIPSEGNFKVSMRLVPNQTVEKVCKLFESYIKKICPLGVTAEVKYLHGGGPVLVPPGNPYLLLAKKAMEQAFNKSALLIREGASVPIASTFKDALKAEPIMMGFDVPTGNIHAPNENLILENFYKGMKAAMYFYKGAAIVTR